MLLGFQATYQAVRNKLENCFHGKQDRKRDVQVVANISVRFALAIILLRCTQIKTLNAMKTLFALFSSKPYVPHFLTL